MSSTIPVLRLPLVVPAVLGAGAVLALWSTEGRASSPPPATAPEPVASIGAPAEPLRAALPPAPVPAPAEPAAESAREFLAQWHGERWPALERTLEQSGLDLDQPYQQKPWEEVAPRLESLIGVSVEKRAQLVHLFQRWPATPDVASLRAEFSHVRGRPLDETDVAAIGTLVEPLNAEIAAHAELYVDLLDLHVHERWTAGRFVRAPFTTMGVATEQGFHSESHGGDGWAVTITLKHEDCPDLVQLERDMAELRHERDASVESYLRAR